MKVTGETPELVEDPASLPIVHHKFSMNWPGINPDLCGAWSVTDRPDHNPSFDTSLHTLHKPLIFLYLQFVSLSFV
jgi:hypothetical protein